jgi:hypothetical protein
MAMILWLIFGTILITAFSGYLYVTYHGMNHRGASAWSKMLLRTLWPWAVALVWWKLW